jgi:hypothetical protein
MTDEELDETLQALAEQIKQLPEDPAAPLTKDEKKRRVILRAKREALNRMKAARENGNLRQEARASLDYALLVEHGEKNPLLFNFIRARLGGIAWW